MRAIAVLLVMGYHAGIPGFHGGRAGVERSYGLYLYHWPIFLFIGIDTRPHILMVGFGASFPATWLSYALIERPFLQVKRRWGRSPTRATLEPAS